MKSNAELIFLAFSMLLSVVSFSQTYWADWDTNLLSAIEEASSFSEYTELEERVAFVINVLRADPERFKEDVLIPYAGNQAIAKDRAYRSLLKELSSLSPLPLLRPHELLYQTAQKHATDMGKSGKTGHQSSRGKSFEKRMAPLMEVFTGVGENCHYGSSDALFIVIDLLIDSGVPGYGHRKNLLQPNFIYLGVSIEPHEAYDVNCVQEFSGELQ